MEGNRKRGHKKWLLLLLLLGGVGAFAYLFSRDDRSHSEKVTQIQAKTSEPEAGKKATVTKTVTTSKVVSKEEETTVSPNGGLLASIFKYFDDKLDDLRRNPKDQSDQSEPLTTDRGNVGQPQGPYYGYPKDEPGSPPTLRDTGRNTPRSVPREDLSVGSPPKKDAKTPSSPVKPKNHISNLNDFPVNKPLTLSSSGGNPVTWKINPPQNLSVLDTNLASSGIQTSRDQLETRDYIALFGPRLLKGVFDLAELYLSPSPDRPTATLTVVEPQDGLSKLAKSENAPMTNPFKLKEAIQTGENSVETTTTYDLVALKHCIDRWTTRLTPPGGETGEHNPSERASEVCQRTLALYDTGNSISN